MCECVDEYECVPNYGNIGTSATFPRLPKHTLTKSQLFVATRITAHTHEQQSNVSGGGLATGSYDECGPTRLLQPELVVCITFHVTPPPPASSTLLTPRHERTSLVSSFSCFIRAYSHIHFTVEIHSLPLDPHIRHTNRTSAQNES
jgi:hypothetical protein